MTRIASSFTRSVDGWTMIGDVSEFARKSTGGSPGGFLFWRDAARGDASYWQAPAKFLGDLSGFVGGKLSFNWTSSGTGYLDPDVKITGANGTTIVADLPEPTTSWSHAAVKLSVAGHWHIGSLSGATATRAQIAAVLHDVDKLQIRAEHVNGDETGGLDTVVLASRPAPSLADAFGADRHESFGGWITHPHDLTAAHVALA